MSGLRYSKILFLKKLEEMRTRGATNDYYELLMAAGLLRSLLFDGGSTLLHHANRDLKLKVQFTLPSVPQVEMSPGVSFYVAILDFERSSAHNTVSLNPDEFGRFRCLVSNGHVFTIQDIVKTCANTRGGIHLGKVDSKDSAGLAADYVRMWGQPTTMFMLSAIIKSASFALEPLAEAINTQLARE